jgi:hypothetical protein
LFAAFTPASARERAEELKALLARAEAQAHMWETRAPTRSMPTRIWRRASLADTARTGARDGARNANLYRKHFGGGVSLAASPPSDVMFCLSRRFSNVSSVFSVHRTRTQVLNLVGRRCPRRIASPHSARAGMAKVNNAPAARHSCPIAE